MSFLDKYAEIKNDPEAGLKEKVSRLRDAIVEFRKNPEKPPRLDFLLKQKTNLCKIMQFMLLNMIPVIYALLLKKTS